MNRIHNKLITIKSLIISEVDKIESKFCKSNKEFSFASDLDFLKVWLHLNLIFDFSENYLHFDKS